MILVVSFDTLAKGPRVCVCVCVEGGGQRVQRVQRVQRSKQNRPNRHSFQVDLESNGAWQV